VVRALREVLPAEEVVYLGDTGRGPYANKSELLIREYVTGLIEQLRLFAPKHVVIGCNVMAAVALGGLRGKFVDFGISGIVDAAARAATERAGQGRTPLIGVVAPEATIRSKAYERAIHRRRHHARMLLRPAPLLDALAEEGREEDDVLLRLALRQYINPMVARGANVIVLGSGWHSLFKRQVQRIAGDGVAIVDSAESCAQDVARRLLANGLMRGGDPSGAVHCLLTDETPRFAFLARRLLGFDVESPKVIAVNDLYRESAEQIRVSA